MLGREAVQRHIGLRNIGHQTLPKIWIYTRLVRGVLTRELLVIDSNYKNRNQKFIPAEGYFGSAFPAICNHCEAVNVVAA